ncbi:hypothetical protein E2562_024738 [Oryza meyeriana var. granulata]|uniref:Uncharacterized protein n=1 Tax=Oryza meyeriana var. granulata TaxID=110450 RepID=A0A6G1D865_9ORYZ|nr:hypothetical protein E2562_024738 [Oryza meyeriana var. granulata]
MSGYRAARTYPWSPSFRFVDAYLPRVVVATGDDDAAEAILPQDVSDFDYVGCPRTRLMD